MAVAELASSTAVSARSIRKVFGATIAVNDVSFDILSGDTHALLGENGAGKSTLVKLLSGLILPTTGDFAIFGQNAVLDYPGAAHRLGVQTAFQELSMVPDLTVLDNMLLPYAPTRAGQIRRREARRAVGEHLETIGLASIDLDDELRDLDLNERQKIEIARALFRRPRILLLDEPTSTLSGRDIDWLGELIKGLKRAGVTIVFISHRMREVRAFCDRVTVLRSGKHIATAPLAEVSDEDMIGMIAGKDLTHAFPAKQRAPDVVGAPVLTIDGLAANGRLHGVSFELRAGEILGVAGLQGMGQLELFSALFGAAEASGGIRVDGLPVVFASPRDAIEARIGISLLPEDRKTEALFLKLDGCRNASLPVSDRYAQWGLIDEVREEAEVARVFSRLNIQMRALWTPTKAFSGGNQQKIALAKWILAQSRVLLLFDPTRGIDVGTKQEIYALIQDYASQGGAVLYYSTEIAELDHLAHRVLVLYAGKIAANLSGAEISEDAILRATLGGGSHVLETA